MFSNGKPTKDYSQVSLDDFSDDDSDGGGRTKSGSGGSLHNRNAINKNGYSDSSTNRYTDSGNDDEYDENDFAQNSIRQQQQLMKQQDEGLDMLSKSVERLGQLSMGISEELGQQNKMLDSMETDLDTAGEELDIVTKKTKELIAKAGGTSNFCIIVALSIVVLVLLFFLIYG